MKTKFVILALFVFCLPVMGNSQTSIVTGFLFDDKNKPEAGIGVVVNGITGITLANGQFTIDSKSLQQLEHHLLSVGTSQDGRY